MSYVFTYSWVKKKITELKAERNELQQEIAKLQEEKDQEMKTYKTMKDKKKEVKHKYEANVWERVDTERELKKLAENLTMIESKIEEAKNASSVTDSLEEVLEKLKTRIRIVIEKRKKLQQQREKLEQQLAETKQNLAEGHNISSSRLQQKREDTDMLFQQFNSRRNISDVVLKLYGDVSMIKHKTSAETIRRNNLSCMAQLQFQQIRHRIQLCSEDRKAISKRLDDCMSLSSNLCEGFEDVTKKTSDVLVEIEGGIITDIQDSAVNIIGNIEDHLRSVEMINTKNEGSVDLSEAEKLVETEREALCKLDERQLRVSEQLKELEIKINRLRRMRQHIESEKKRSNSEVTAPAAVPAASSRHGRKASKSISSVK